MSWCVLRAQEIPADVQQQLNSYKDQAASSHQQNNTIEEAKFYNKIAYLYWDYQKNEEAIDYFKKSLYLNEEINNRNAIRVINKNMGLIYSDIGKFNESLSHLNTSLEYNKAMGKKSEIVADMLTIGAIRSYQKNYDESLKITEEALTKAKELNDIKLIKNAYSQLAEVHEEAGNSQQSFEYYQQYASIQKHLQQEELTELASKNEQTREELQQQSQQLEKAKDEVVEAHEQVTAAIEEKEKIALERELLAQENELKEAELKSSRYLISILAGGSIFVVIITILVFIQMRQKKKANNLLRQQHEEIVNQKSQIEDQHNTLQKQQQKITDSIHYAQRIQKAVLPPDDYINAFIDDYFILLKPRDIVSGDFYWITKKDDTVIMAAADCTGHGVPGAFMSMLGVAFLNEIVNKISVNKHVSALQSDEILTQLREYVIHSLHQKGDREEAKDGMDIALCIIDLERMKLQYSGAHNPLYIIRNHELQQYNADKMPIALNEMATRPFSKHDIDLQQGDLIYLFSDGYVDQFGGKNGRKFLAKNFKSLLVDIHDKPMDEQKKLLDSKIEQWKGDREQLDDILVMGFKVPDKLKKRQPATIKDW
ncbi:MAG: SpoIIE family protein phosphatase, partial [Bacteroidetes bacterium]|nr:SpoIIE family protein phosphatase [Bacteroidota bacterium]